MTADDEILRRLNGESPPLADNWMPSTGDVLIGEVVDLAEVGSKHGAYPVVVVKPDDGDRLAWHAKPTVAKNELAKAAPEVGDRIGIRYDGQHTERNYHQFKVVLGRPTRIDWSRYHRAGKR